MVAANTLPQVDDTRSLYQSDTLRLHDSDWTGSATARFEDTLVPPEVVVKRISGSTPDGDLFEVVPNYDDALLSDFYESYGGMRFAASRAYQQKNFV